MNTTREKLTIVIVLLILLLALSACSMISFLQGEPKDSSEIIATQVAATIQSLETQNATIPKEPDPTPTETVESFGTISGKLGYPSEFIPTMRVVAFNLETNAYYYVDTETNQGTYQIENLPQGTYHVVAYVQDMGMDFPGAYTEFVVCGLTADCQDHQLVDVEVYAGQTTEGIDPIDFYVMPEETDWPEDPTQ